MNGGYRGCGLFLSSATTALITDLHEKSVGFRVIEWRYRVECPDIGGVHEPRRRLQSRYAMLYWHVLNSSADVIISTTVADVNMVHTTESPLPFV